jgi:hypothetical protein
MNSEEVNRALKSIDLEGLHTPSEKLIAYVSVVNAVIAATDQPVVCERGTF